MPKSHGLRSRTRNILKRRGNRRGFTRNLLTLRELQKGDKVVIYIDPSEHRGMPHRRYHGKTATILGRRGISFKVETCKGDKRVVLIVRPEHLKPI